MQIFLTLGIIITLHKNNNTCLFLFYALLFFSFLSIDSIKICSWHFWINFHFPFGCREWLLSKLSLWLHDSINAKDKRHSTIDLNKIWIACHSFIIMHRQRKDRWGNLPTWCALRLAYPEIHQVYQVIWKPDQIVRGVQHSSSNFHSQFLLGCNMDI